MRKLIPILVFFVCIACNGKLSEPQIWIDISPVYVGMRSISPEAGPQHFDLQLTNRGEKVLKINSINVRGDQYCAFTFEGPDTKELGENQSAFLRGIYQPKIAAEDQISLEVSSNSYEYSLLVVPICGKGVYPETVDAGPAPSCNVPPPDQPNCQTR